MDNEWRRKGPESYQKSDDGQHMKIVGFNHTLGRKTRVPQGGCRQRAKSRRFPASKICRFHIVIVRKTVLHRGKRYVVRVGKNP